VYQRRICTITGSARNFPAGSVEIWLIRTRGNVVGAARKFPQNKKNPPPAGCSQDCRPWDGYSPAHPHEDKPSLGSWYTKHEGAGRAPPWSPILSFPEKSGRKEDQHPAKFRCFISACPSYSAAGETLKGVVTLLWSRFLQQTAPVLYR
jgi:hypothetical protein